MYTEETAMKKQQVFEKDVSSERMEQLKEENTLRKCVMQDIKLS